MIRNKRGISLIALIIIVAIIFAAAVILIMFFYKHQRYVFKSEQFSRFDY